MTAWLADVARSVQIPVHTPDKIYSHLAMKLPSLGMLYLKS